MQVNIEDIYENRLLLLIEDNEKGVFYQVLLDSEQFLTISKAITKVTKEEAIPGFQITEIRVNTKPIPADIFTGMPTIAL